MPRRRRDDARGPPDGAAHDELVRGLPPAERRRRPTDHLHGMSSLSPRDDGDLTRRDFLKLLGASAGVASLAGCTRMPAEKILPYVVQPPEATPGRPRFYAT